MFCMTFQGFVFACHQTLLLIIVGMLEDAGIKHEFNYILILTSR